MPVNNCLRWGACGIIICCVFVFIEQKQTWAQTQNTPKNVITIDVRQQTLDMILEEIFQQCGVNILGLDRRIKELVTFSANAEPIEKVIKRLLRQLDEDNFAFEYSKTQLIRVSVLSGSRANVSQTAPAPLLIDEKEKIVQILRINPETQAERADLRKGDLIFEYDGSRIHSAQQLVKAVKNKSPEETVEMVVIREGLPFRVILNGGLIGVNIATISVFKSEIKQ